jgi:methyltransferase (TIGR00027 family)
MAPGSRAPVADPTIRGHKSRSMIDLSNMLSVGQLRHIQSRYERPEYRNPDTAVSDFLPISRRLECFIRGTFLLPNLRSKPFYRYLLSRTNYYDEMFVGAIWDSVDFIVNVGCGMDTRPYRFAHLLRQRGVAVLECDQPAAISRKRRLARRRWPTDHVAYLPIDLDHDAWPDFERWLGEHRSARVLILMEGVSPYISQAAFGCFLRLLGRMLSPGSVVAYDFKIAGAADDFGRSEKTRRPFRLPADRPEVIAFHHAMGYRLDHMELSSELSGRLSPRRACTWPPLFQEDCLVRLTVDRG